MPGRPGGDLRGAGRTEEAVTLFGGATIRGTYGVAASLPERSEAVAQLDALRAGLSAETFRSYGKPASS